MDKMYFIVFGLFSIVGPSIWCVVLLIISFSSGWQALAACYATQQFPEKTKSCSGIFNHSSNYTGTLEYAETEEGLYLKTSILFRVGHRPLFIPWNAMKKFEESSSFFSAYVTSFRVDHTHIQLNTDSPLLK